MRTKKVFTQVVFDRKKQLKTKGVGKVEICVRLSKTQKKHITVKTCTESMWKQYSKSAELAQEVQVYSSVAEMMYRNGAPMTIEHFDGILGIGSSKVNKEKRDMLASRTGFVDFMEKMIEREDIREGTRKQKMVSVHALRQYGDLCSFASLTPRNIVAFDEWLHDGGRTQVTVAKYHKALKIYARKAFQRGYIDKNPYDDEMCHFKQGRSKERKPLTEAELIGMRSLVGLPKYEERARDLFVFCAYTGLAYADCMAFDFGTMTDYTDEMYYIDGARVKTGSTFYTPILPPALEILKKYRFQLPKISNQKMNQYLHIIESRMNLNKPVTSHIARHSFATLCLSHDIPLDKVSRMLGHQHQRTTAIYAKILKSTINRHAIALASQIK